LSGKSNPVSAAPILPILACCLGIFVLTAMDAVMKGLVLAVGVYNTLFWRSTFAAAAGGIAWAFGPRAWPARIVLGLFVKRAFVIAFITVLFFWGLARLPLAEAIAISFVAPLVALYLAAVLLGERIGRSAIWGSIAGMAGVLVIVAGKFGQAEFSEDAALGVVSVLLSAVGYAYNLILMRQQAQVASVREIAFYQNVILLLIFAAAAPFVGIVVPTDNWLEVGVVTALNLTGLTVLTWAFARAEAQYLVPTEYTAFIWAAALGWAVFDETVGWTTIAGAGLIVAGCLIVALTKPKLVVPIEAAVV
jgi:S-adenosylmethionine uptake transporter